MNKILFFILLIISINAKCQNCEKFTGDYDSWRSLIFIDGPMTGYTDTIVERFSISSKSNDTIIFRNFGGFDKLIGFCRKDSVIIPVHNFSSEGDGVVVSILGAGKLRNDTLFFEYSQGGKFMGGLMFCTGRAVKSVNSNQVLFKNEGEINCFPNPFSDIITIEISGTEQFTIEILNSGGQKVFENNVPAQNRFQVNLSGFPAGIYFVKATSGKKVLVQKIIKY